MLQSREPRAESRDCSAWPSTVGSAQVRHEGVGESKRKLRALLACLDVVDDKRDSNDLEAPPRHRSTAQRSSSSPSRVASPYAPPGAGAEESQGLYDEDGNRLVRVCGQTCVRKLLVFRTLLVIGLVLAICGIVSGAEGDRCVGGEGREVSGKEGEGEGHQGGGQARCFTNAADRHSNATPMLLYSSHVSLMLHSTRRDAWLENATPMCSCECCVVECRRMFAFASDPRVQPLAIPKTQNPKPSTTLRNPWRRTRRAGAAALLLFAILLMCAGNCFEISKICRHWTDYSGSDYDDASSDEADERSSDTSRASEQAHSRDDTALSASRSSRNRDATLNLQPIPEAEAEAEAKEGVRPPSPAQEGAAMSAQPGAAPRERREGRGRTSRVAGERAGAMGPAGWVLSDFIAQSRMGEAGGERRGGGG
jgi:hypothetical protein